MTGTGIPPAAFVGAVTNTFVPAQASAGNGGFVDTGAFALVDSAGRPLRTIASVSGVTLGARTPATDPLYNATAATNGGGDTGSVLISPYIRPGSVSTGFYNHYSWLRTIEDLFNVRRASRGPRRSGSHRLRRPARARAVRTGRVHASAGPPGARAHIATAGSRRGCARS